MGKTVGVLGATSMVGQSLLPLLVNAGWRVQAYTRQTQLAGQEAGKDVPIIFKTLATIGTNSDFEKIPDWVCLAPIWVLPDHFPMLNAYQARRVVALGSTSIFTKRHSSDAAEQGVAEKLSNGERRFIAWAEANQIEWVILRPTLIYGLGRDRNIGEIAQFISRFGFFPLLGAAQGMRQPVHVEDVASACAAALQNPQSANHAYNLSGAERLPYREMVSRVFNAMDKPTRFVNVPIIVFRAAIACLQVFPRFRNWSVGMAERMNNDLVFDHADATRDLGFMPKAFQLTPADLPTVKNRIYT